MRVLVLVQKFTLAWEAQAVIWGARPKKPPPPPLCIGVARIFDWGRAKPKMTCNDVIRNFREKLFARQRHRRMMIRSRGLVWHLTKSFFKMEKLKPKVKNENL